MPPKKRGREALTPNSKSKPDTQQRKPNPSPPPLPLQVTSDTPSPAVGPNILAKDAPAGPTARSLSGGPSARKAVQKVETPFPEQTPLMAPADSTASALSLPVGPQSESAGGKSNLKKKVVKKVVRKVKKPCLTGGTEPQLVDANSNTKMDLEKPNPIEITIADTKPSVPTSPVEAAVEETPVVPKEVLTTNRESLTSRPEPNAEKSSEAMESGMVKGNVKKVIRKVIKKRIVKKMVPKSTLASQKAAAEAVLGLAEEQAKLGDVETSQAGEEKEKSIVQGVNPTHNTKHSKEEIRLRICENKGKGIVQGVNPTHNTKHSKEEIGLRIGENKGNNGEKNNERDGDSREDPSSQSGNKKEGEESKEIIVKIERDMENKNKIIADSGNRKEINGEIKVGDEGQNEKVDCSSSNTKKKVRKVIKKRIIKKLVPKGTLLAKRSAEENLNVAAKSQAEKEDTLTLSDRPLNQKPSSSSGIKPEQAQAKELSVSNKGSPNAKNPKHSSNAETQKEIEIEGLKERQKIKPTKLPAKQSAKATVTPGKKLEAENPGPNTKEEIPQQGFVDKIPQKPNYTLNAGAEVMDGLTERQRRRKTEIFIGGLDKEVREIDIRTVFEKAGEIVEVRMFTENNTGKNKGYCFLRYKEPAQAKKAISMFSKVEICGKRCGAAAVEDNDNIFIGNIDKRWKKEDIIKMLEDFGIEKIDTVTVVPDPQNPELNRGFAFLELETNRDAQVAYKKLKAADFSKGGHVRIDWAEPWYEPNEEEMLKVKSVYVECMPSSWDKAKMSEIFKKFGQIERVVLARDIPSSKRKDYAFVNYTAREAAISCIELVEKDGLVVDGSKVNVKVSLAKPVSRGKPMKGGGRPSASEKDKQKMLPSAQSSTPNSLRVLREPAPHQEIGYPKGKTFENHSHGLHGEKRGLAALSDDPVYSDMRGCPRPRYDSSYYRSYDSSSSIASYGGKQLYGIGEPSPYYQSPNYGYASGFYNGKQSYYPDTSEASERAIPPGQRSWPYPRY